jgi:hypothetical protein
MIDIEEPLMVWFFGSFPHHSAQRQGRSVSFVRFRLARMHILSRFMLYRRLCFGADILFLGLVPSWFSFHQHVTATKQHSQYPAFRGS